MVKLIGAVLMLYSLFMTMPHAYAGKQGPNDQEVAWFQTISQGNEKVAKLHFYVQDVIGGKNPTVYEVARASITSNSNTFFGQVIVMDDLLTVGPDYDSEKLGRVQGILASADLEVYAFTVNLNFVFTSGKYNGSTIAIGGRNPIESVVREVPVVGGTGVFRMARGYAITTTYSSNSTDNSSVIEYTIYVSYVDEYNMQLRSHE